MRTIADLCNQAGLDHLADRLTALQQPCIRGAMTPDVPVIPGASRLGGNPDVPLGFVWPHFRDEPLAFIGQLNLADVSHPLLPKQGLLLFFYNLDTWGFKPQDRDSAQVIYIPVSAHLHSITPPFKTIKKLWGLLKPDKKPRVFKSCGLKLTNGFSLPSDERDSITDFISDEAESEQYIEMREELISDLQMFGYPDPIQSDNMEQECQLVTHGIDCGNVSGYQEARTAELNWQSSDWLLLLQLGDSSYTDMMWGDAGRIYFWIRRADLDREDFSKIWLILQCH